VSASLRYATVRTGFMRGAGRGVHAAHGPAHEPDANRRDALAAHSRVAFA